LRQNAKGDQLGCAEAQTYRLMAQQTIATH